MNLYIFVYHVKKITEEIQLIHIKDNNICISRIGNIYNLVDYINNNIKETSKIKFNNFPGNKLSFIVSAITKYKKITSAEEYYSLIVTNKKRIRGR